MTVSSPDSAWAVFEPGENKPWSLVQAGHLLRRSGFGANWSQLQSTLRRGPRESLARLLDPEANAETFNQAYDEYERSGGTSEESLAAWWLRRMLETPTPLLEKLTLFWHGHFAVKRSKVGSPSLMVDHVQRLRKHALGDYRELLSAVMQDPATFLTLDSPQNRRRAPNTAVTRQLLEQYTLGPRLTSDHDVQEAARAYTGWFVRNERLRFVQREHDSGVKTFLGRRGKWDAQGILNILFDHPAVPRLIVKKLYRFLISEMEPAPDSLIVPLADSFAKNYHIGELVGKILGSNLFFSNAAYGNRVKSPVEYVLGIAHAFETQLPTLPLSQDLKKLGQELYNPPTRMGWPDGLAWITASTLIERANFAGDLLSPAGRYGGKVDPTKLFAGTKRVGTDSQLRRLSDVFLQRHLDKGVEDKLIQSASTGNRSQRLIHGFVALPEFQLA